MIWSDSTHLAQFGMAHIWPIYVFPGNMVNWFRARPNSHSCEHWAYIPSLPDSIQDFIQEITGGQAGTASLLTHCWCKFIQAVWALLLDDDFMMGYKQGIVILCADGILCHVFLCLFTYSTDYPEKMLMLSLRDKGNCPCPRCLVTKKEISELGLQRDHKHHKTRSCEETRAQHADVSLACQFIYQKNSYKFSKYMMFVVDLMHEFELGVWKAVFIHLIWLLYELGSDRVNELNLR
ncbi:hypothetical protein K439DRAFT_1646644 [Ramaria rubella]|nr:hypothetical protein K439DRAFT_1646644 [Ramaria rubella]